MQNISRRSFSKAVLGAGLLVYGKSALLQENFPAKEIKFIVSSTPGAMTDQASRIFADKMSAFLKVPIIIENVAGAGSMVASRQVSRARPDGYTILATANSMLAIPHIDPKAGYASSDFSPIGELARSPSVLVVSGQSPYHSLADLVKDAKQNPGKLSFASGGVGTTSHIPTELFMKQAGIQAEHIPYRSIAQAIPDVVGGRTEFVMGTASSFHGPLRTGELRALGITTSERSPDFPDIPTFKELGYDDATFEIWIGLLAPKNTPDAIVNKIAEALQMAKQDQKLLDFFAASGQFVAKDSTPEKFRQVMLDDEVQMKGIIEHANISI